MGAGLWKGTRMLDLIMIVLTVATFALMFSLAAWFDKI